MIKILCWGFMLSSLAACASLQEENSAVGDLPKESIHGCLPDEAAKLIGRSGLTEEQIKQKTRSEIVRTIGPNQAVTMDYYAGRITVTINPVSKKIINAACG